MQNHPIFDSALLLAEVRERRAQAAHLRVARQARGPRRLASSGVRHGIARWVSRSLLRAEPCAQETAAQA
jgi:hypothetical protein